MRSINSRPRINNGLIPMDILMNENFLYIGNLLRDKIIARMNQHPAYRVDIARNLSLLIDYLSVISKIRDNIFSDKNILIPAINDLGIRDFLYRYIGIHIEAEEIRYIKNLCSSNGSMRTQILFNSRISYSDEIKTFMQQLGLPIQSSRNLEELYKQFENGLIDSTSSVMLLYLSNYDLSNLVTLKGFTLAIDGYKYINLQNVRLESEQVSFNDLDCILELRKDNSEEDNYFLSEYYLNNILMSISSIQNIILVKQLIRKFIRTVEAKDNQIRFNLAGFQLNRLPFNGLAFVNQVKQKLFNEFNHLYFLAYSEEGDKFFNIDNTFVYSLKDIRDHDLLRSSAHLAKIYRHIFIDSASYADDSRQLYELQSAFADFLRETDKLTEMKLLEILFTDIFIIPKGIFNKVPLSDIGYKMVNSFIDILSNRWVTIELKAKIADCLEQAEQTASALVFEYKRELKKALNFSSIIAQNNPLDELSMDGKTHDFTDNSYFCIFDEIISDKVNKYLNLSKYLEEYSCVMVYEQKRAFYQAYELESSREGELDIVMLSWLIQGILDDQGVKSKLVDRMISGKIDLSNYPRIQLDIIRYISEDKNTKQRHLQQLLAMNLATMNITGTEAQLNLINAIRQNKFKENKELFRLLAASITKMKLTDNHVQNQFAIALHSMKFSFDKEALMTIAEGLGDMNLTNPLALQMITATINQGKFSTDIQVLTRLAKSLGVMNICDDLVQLNLAKAIFAKSFTNQKEVLKELARSLGKMNFTNSKAQKIIADAIREEKFTDEKEVMIELARSLGKMNFTNSKAQKIIADAIYEERLTSEKEVMIELARSLGKMNFTDLEAQMIIADAIYEERLTSEKEVMIELARSLGKMNFTDSEAQVIIANAILEERFTNDRLILGELASSISCWVISNEQILIRLKEKLGIGYLFGIPMKFEEDRQLANLIFPNYQDINIEYTTLHNPETMGSYGVIYNSAKKPLLFIVYSVSISEVGIEYQKEQMLGFFRINKHTAPLYQHNISNLKVYKLIDLKDEFPVLLDELSPQCKDFNLLPKWLKEIVINMQFNPEDYKFANIINFVFEIADVITDNKLRGIIKATIERTIMNQGNPISLGETVKEDIEIKDSINFAFIQADQLASLKDKLDKFYISLPDRSSKLKLLFLLGQIAKRGALGYDHGGKNQANELFYTLALKVASLIKAEDGEQEDKTLLDLIKCLEEGGCIEQATYLFAIEKQNNHVLEIWDTINYS